MYSERPPPHPPIPWWKIVKNSVKHLTRIPTIQVAKGHTLYAPDAQQSHDSFRHEIMGSLLWKKGYKGARQESSTIKKAAHYHILANFPLLSIYSSSETCDGSRNPTKMDEYTQMMIQRRFTRGQGSPEEFLQSMGLGQYRLGRTVRQLDKNINHSHILSRNKIH